MKNNFIIGILVIVVLGGLFWLGNQSQQKSIRYFGDTNVACLPNGHQNIELHIHPILKIKVDGEPEQVPANIGIVGSCMAEIHTHDASGTIHVETFDSERMDNINLGSFFAVWGREAQRDGYILEVVQDGTVKRGVDDVMMIDHSVIELNYTSTNLNSETN